MVEDFVNDVFAECHCRYLPRLSQSCRWSFFSFVTQTSGLKSEIFNFCLFIHRIKRIVVEIQQHPANILGTILTLPVVSSNAVLMSALKSFLLRSHAMVGEAEVFVCQFIDIRKLPCRRCLSGNAVTCLYNTIGTPAVMVDLGFILFNVPGNVYRIIDIAGF